MNEQIKEGKTSHWALNINSVGQARVQTSSLNKPSLYMSVLLSFKRLRQEDEKFNAVLSYTVSLAQLGLYDISCQKKKWVWWQEWQLNQFADIRTSEATWKRKQAWLQQLVIQSCGGRDREIPTAHWPDSTNLLVMTRPKPSIRG